MYILKRLKQAFIILSMMWISSVQVKAQSFQLLNQIPSSLPMYSKLELQFQIPDNSAYPFFAYDTQPPSGVQSGVGITVEAIIQTPSGTVKQPAFYETVVTTSGSGNKTEFYETGQKRWVVRYAPRQTGTHRVVSIHAISSGGDHTYQIGSQFNVTNSSNKGFIKVSKADTRYFEFDNGEIYWPMGPAWGPGYSQYTGTGQNLHRQWMAGIGAYSGNWARWISSAENHGNEGFMNRLNYQEHYPGHELSYELFYPEGYRFWITYWQSENMPPTLSSGKRYRASLTYKTANLAGPRTSGQPYGLVVKTDNTGAFNNPSMSTFENDKRNAQRIINHISANQNWTTITADFTANSTTSNVYVYLDNVSGGQAYIDELSIREIKSDGSLGGEVIRNPRADIHTYVDPRGAAYFDWQIAEAEKSGVYLKYVLHDKNDWIQNHLTLDGRWTERENGNGYNQADNSKARWLLRQWYRYVIARWGYSTAVHSWEAVNEDNPNDTMAWNSAQNLGRFMHQNDSHPHLVTTSFWCCFKPAFWGDSSKYPDVDYADIHEYTGMHEVSGTNSMYDMAVWNINTGNIAYRAQINKPVMRAETGITAEGGWDAISTLKTSNPGIWYKNLLWPQLSVSAMTDPNYWYDSHLNQIDRMSISKAFNNYIKDVDLNKGGYVDLAASSSNSKLRVYGQKNTSKGKVYAWIQNSDHTWKKYMDGVRSSESGTVRLKLNPNTAYKVEWWNTGTGSISSTQNMTANSSGEIALTVSNLSDDIAVKIMPQGSSNPTPTPTVYKPGDADGDGRVDGVDYSIWHNNYTKLTSQGVRDADFNLDGRVDGVDYSIWHNNY